MSRAALSVCLFILFGDVCGLYRSHFFNKVKIQHSHIYVLHPFLLWETKTASNQLCAVTCLELSCLSYFLDKQSGFCQMFSVNIENQSGNKPSNLELYQRQGTCEEFGYTTLQSTRKCLKLYYTQMTWLTANSICASAGGKLFGIKSAETFEEVLNTTSRKDRSFHNFMIDGNDIESEGNWVMSDGSPVLFLPWKVGEPGKGAAENCLLVVGEFYHDAPCHTYLFKFICEKHFILLL